MKFMSLALSEFVIYMLKSTSYYIWSNYMPDAENRPLVKVEKPIHDNIRELVTWECKEHVVKL
jgi:hypothetical protein